MMIIVDQSKQNPSEIQPSEITSQSVYSNRRHFIKLAASSGLITSAALLSLKAKAANIAGSGSTSRTTLSARTNTPQSTKSLKKDAIYNPRQKLEGVIKSGYGRDLKIDTYDNITTYNNYYEFGTDKSNPVVQARTFQPNPWTISIEGEVKKPKTMSIEALMKLTTLEERIYRMRCVEGWSMVIPWVGLPLASLIKWAEPTGNAKYVEFVTANDPDSMPGVNAPILDWPYTEGLRIDEAMHPLTLIAVGLYGELLPNQNGAPARLVVPWKYGFKGGKSIVKIRFVEKMPQTTWMQAGPTEYGFFANVNPKVSHPRWSQSTERPIGGGLFGGRIKTKMFNGYESEVGQLYAGMDLRKYF